MDKFNFNISLSVLNHLGRNLYRNFLTVLGEAVSFFGITSSPTVLILNSFIYPESETNNLKAYFDRTLSVLNKALDINKIRIFVLENDLHTPINDFIKIGFKKEFSMIKEIGNNDLLSYYMMIKE